MWGKTAHKNKNMILVKLHHSARSIIACLCDSELIGRKFQDAKHQLDITARFYKGDAMPEEKIIPLLKTAGNLNIVGKASIALAVKAGIINKASIIKIKTIPHAQVFRI